ncbi:hypothetical protein B9G79_00845 [Bdellovibrio bacteriovorus]|uniref:Uncharacterized protein n=1 Tax=Bdellovibrio bacteriovorus TaxID=959 RepID=A0A1Z3N411_BDEBC|nr:hypothetical protein B9G79_00845 [Bdellovibrio bacteriovorus]
MAVRALAVVDTEDWLPLHFGISGAEHADTQLFTEVPQSWRYPITATLAAWATRPILEQLS